MKVFLVLVALVLAVPVSAARLTPAQMQSDLDQVVTMMESGYGPLLYKKKLGMDLAMIKAKYSELLKSTKSNGEFYYTIRAFVSEFKDSHFGAAIPTDHVSSLGFVTDLIQNKVLIDTIDRTKLPEAVFPFQKGDEIVAIDGKDASALLDDLSVVVNSGYEKHRRRIAAMMVAVRSGAAVMTPTGEVTVRIRRGTSSITEDVKMKWLETGKASDELNSEKTVLSQGSRTRDFNQVSIDFDDYTGPNAEKSFRCSGTTRIAIPKDATIIMESPFVAYYHPTAKGKLGYLRIPHYSPVNETTGAKEYEIRFAQYEYAISILEKNTVGLIIDQDHNCGGSVEWLEKMLGLFMPKDFVPMQFQLLANKSEYMSFMEWANEVNRFTIEYQNVFKVAELLKATWLKGEEYLTSMTSISGAETLAPHSIRYTKPIVMLIDEMSGSGGDAFPVMMKGYGRAKLFGTRTMGAGGHVEMQPPLNYSRIQVRLTKSLFYRPDGVAVENNGAEPDFQYSPTRDDFMYGYKNYQKAYLEALLARIGEVKVSGDDPRI